MLGRRARIAVVIALLAAGAPACGSSDGSDDDDDDDDGPQFEPAPLVPGEYTYTLEEGTDAVPLWTTPPTHKLTAGDRPPESQGSGLSLSAARREFEPVQIVMGPGEGTVSVQVEPFPDLGSEQRTELAVVGLENGWAETLTPLMPSDALELEAARGTAVWLTVYVPEGAPAGRHETTLTISPQAGGSIDVPVGLYVFDFSLPPSASFATQLNLSIESLTAGGRSVDEAKSLLFEHRMTPKSVTWPSGFHWNITWDNDTPTRCSALYDEPDEGAAYSIQHLARRYILGEGWNGVGFPTAMLFQFVDNSTPRPATFCDIERGDHFGSDAYNQAWSEWLSALNTYLVENGYAERAYYYVQNEPQDEADHQLAAHLCRLTKAAAPNLRIAVSDEPKPEIAEDPDGACGYDIWIAHLRAYAEDYAWQRQRDHGETVWFYSLDHDPDPYFNPTDVERQGIHQRIIPWTAWAHRITGWAYYDANRFFRDGRPTVRAELLREGFEDYEYLYLANGGAHPAVFTDEVADGTARSVAASMTSWTKNVDALMTLRHELGSYIEGSRDTLPVLEVTSSRPRGSYYINFQDPEGPPTDEPLTVNGNTYLKVGWEPYTAERGYGWSGEFIDDPGIALFGFDEVAGYPSTQQSYVYDDYGRDNLFEFDLAPGTYRVTVGVGRPGRGYPGQPHNVDIEGQAVVEEEPTTDEQPTIERTVDVELSDGSLSMVVGGRSETIDDYSYTFLGYLIIEPID